MDRDPRTRGFDHAYRFSGYAESPWDRDTRLLSHTPDTYRLLSDDVEEHSYRHDPESTRYEQGETFYQTDVITDYALDFLEHDRCQNESEERQPFFMYLAYGAPHFPLAAPRSLTEKYISRYEAGWDAIRKNRLQRMIDRNLGRLLADLEEHGQRENTLVMFMSDNGACYEWHEFGHSVDDGPRTGTALSAMGTAAAEQGLKYGAGWATAGSTPYRLYKHFGHEGGIRSPLILRWSGLDDSLLDGMVEDVCCSRDIVPTILDLLEIELPEQWTAENGQTYEVADFDDTSESLSGLLADGEPLGDREIAWEHEGNAAYRSGQWKLVGKNFDADGVVAHEWELYDLQIDPVETNNLADDHPKRVHELARRWMDWAEHNDVSIPGGITYPS